MSFSFDATQGLVLVRARIFGPLEPVVARLALDTGATSTLVNPSILRLAGYDPAVSPERV